MGEVKWVMDNFENSHPCACWDLKKRIKFDFENERSVFHSFFNPANRYSPDEESELPLLSGLFNFGLCFFA